MNRVSLLIRTLDRPELLAEALDSVRAQTYRPLEVIVVNDGGESVEAIVRRALGGEQDEALVWRYHDSPDRQGRSAAANQALDMASGKRALFLDDDDWILPDHIERLVQALDNANASGADYIAAYSDTLCYRDGKALARPFFAREFDPLALAVDNYLPIHSVLFERRAWQANCRFSVELSLYEDWYFWLQLARHGDFIRCPGATACYRLEISGIGAGEDRDYRPQYRTFLRQALPVLSDDQLVFLHRAGRELVTAHTRLDCIYDKLGTTQDQLKATSAHLEATQAQLGDANARLETTQAQLGDANARLETTQAQLGDANARLETTQAQLGDANARLDTTQAQLGDTKARLDTTQARLDDANARLDTTQAQLGDANARLDTTQAQLGDANARLESTQAQLGDANARLEQQATSCQPAFIKRVGRKGITFARLVYRGDWAGINQRLGRHRRYLLGDSAAQPTLESQPTAPPAPEPDERVAGIDILCTRHTVFVARRISASLGLMGIAPVRILSDNSGIDSPRLCIVICPQMFDRLPGYYIAFQMEQSVSSRWFNKRYIDQLQHSLAIMEYSHTNLRYLQQSSGISHKQLFYTPVSNLPVGTLAPDAEPDLDKEYDVVFYGDANTPRRQAFLDAIEQRFSLLRVSEVFGDELYDQLRRARVVVNVHYYEGALLETTRLYECLSLGLSVVSESSVDIDEHEVLGPWVRFTPIDDISAMVEAIRAELDDQSAGKAAPPLEDDIAGFHFYFARMLVALDIVQPDALEAPQAKQALPFAPALLEQGVGLSLPETWQRKRAFEDTFPGYPVFPGLRHHQGWRGCALSYSYLARRALEAGLSRLEVREDDALLDAAAAKRWAQASALFDASDDYDVLSGLIADVAEHMTVLDAFTRDGEDYLVIDCMTSTVCNRYGPRAIRLLAEWSFDDSSESNTIDRYLERQHIRVLVPLPFIATHRPDGQSTLWHFQNTTYDSMIENSEKTLCQAFAQAQGQARTRHEHT